MDAVTWTCELGFGSRVEGLMPEDLRWPYVYQRSPKFQRQRAIPEVHETK